MFSLWVKLKTAQILTDKKTWLIIVADIEKCLLLSCLSSTFKIYIASAFSCRQHGTLLLLVAVLSLTFSSRFLSVSNHTVQYVLCMVWNWKSFLFSHSSKKKKNDRNKWSSRSQLLIYFIALFKSCHLEARFIERVECHYFLHKILYISALCFFSVNKGTSTSFLEAEIISRVLF